MAINAPTCIDVLEFQFKIHQKIKIFNRAENLRNHINLLATSSNYGLLFVGDPNKPEFRVLKHQNIIDGEPLEARNVLIPGIPNNIAVSCDGLLLAVSYSLRNSDFLSIFSVPSFLTTNIETKFNIRLHPENNVNVTQILWNPVISGTLAVILNNGAVGMYNLKDTSYEFHSLNKTEQAKCACWSPKGKQIVIGFPDGKLVQYKPDLKPAKTITCPENIHEKPFDTIAVHWLSTYQFAVVFQQKEDVQPCLYILNAPKVGNQTYINYYDICYSGSGPRQSQINFIHIQQWNILLMSSANSVEIGILGTKESGETPMWQQYITPDEARIELPLTNDKQETFPIGFALDTGCVHQLTIGETQIPVMPIIHLLSTHGMLISFNFLNLIPNAPGICSPPNPVSDVSNCFKSIYEILEQRDNASNVSQPLPDANKANQQTTDMSFSLSSNASTSTPTIDRKGNSEPSTFLGNNLALSKPLFGTVNITPTTKSLGTDNFSFSGMQKQQMNQPQSMSTNLFGGQSFGQKSIFGGGVNLQQQTETFGNTISKLPSSTNFGNLNLSQTNIANLQQGLTFGTQLKEGNQLTFGQPTGQNKFLSFQTPQPSSEQQQISSNKQQTIQKVDDVGKMKPLYTISPNFIPSQPQQQQQQQQQMLLQSKQQQIQNVEDIATTECTKSQSDELDVNDIIKQMIMTHIDAFEKELCILSSKTEDLNVSPDEIEETKTYNKRLNDLKEINDRAKDGTVEMDIQILRHSLNECFKMVSEVKSKLNMYKNPQLPQLSTMSNVNQSNRRQLAKLNQMVATNEVQLNIINQLIDNQWSNYQDLVRQNSNKNKYLPNMEAVYQTLLRQKDIIARGRIKLNYFKSKLGIKGLLDNKKIEQNVDVNSLADSILSMSLSEQVSKENSRLTYEKNKQIRESLRNHQIIKIKPQRPNRIGLNSEVILETRERTIKDREGAVTKPEKMEKERVKDEQQQRTLTKPTPTKGVSILHTNQTQQPKTEQQKLSQPVMEVQFTAAAQNTPLFPSIGSSFVKPGEFSQPAMNIFGGGITSNQNSIFGGGNKILEQSKPNFGSLNAATTQNDIPSAGVKNTTFTFSPPNDVNQKESVALSFAPKIIENDQQSLGMGFITIQDENKPAAADMTKESSASTVANANKQTPIITTNQSLFSPLGIGSLSPESKSFSSGTGFSMISIKDTKTNQSSTVSNLTQNVPLSSSNSLSFKAFSVPKPESEATKNQELPSPQSSTSISSENFTSPKSAIESFSFNLALKTPTTTTSPFTSGFSFGNVPKPAAVSTITPTSNAVTSVFSNASADTSLSSNLSTTSSTATVSQSTISFGSVPIPSTLLTATPSIAAPTDLLVKNTSNNEQNLFEGLSICKPTALENATSTSSTFSTTSTTAAATESKSLFDSIATTTTTTSSSSGLNFGSITSSATTGFGGISSPISSGSLFGGTAVSPSSSSLFGNTSNSAIATPLFGSVICTSTPTFSSPTASISTSAPAFGSPTASTSTSAAAFGSPTASTSTSAPAFGSPTASTSTSTPAFGSPTASYSTSATVFGSPTSSTSTSAFGNSTPSTATSVFGTAVTTTAVSLFGSPTSTSTSSIFGSTTPTTSTSIFGGTTSTISPISAFGTATATTSPSGLFAGVPKPVQSVFGGSGVTNFPASNSASLFGGQTSNQPVSNANSIFGGGSTQTSAFGMMTTSAPSAFGTNAISQSTSPFGAPVNTNTSVFGSPKSETTTNLFGTISQSSPTSGGSLFGGSFGNTGQSTGSIFGGSGLPQSSGFGSAFAQPQTSSPFGSTTPQQQSLFGGATSNTSAFGQSTFGGGSSSFGQTTGSFGSTSAIGAFAQGGPSVAQTGFGSPTSFAAKPTFGGSSTFGGSPSFGSPPTFGGTATFGSPKPGFGTFGSTNVGGAFSPPSQKNNLFESLGSTDTGLSFGNLAQNANANAAKPQFGGSSFSSWR